MVLPTRSSGEVIFFSARERTMFSGPWTTAPMDFTGTSWLARAMITSCW